MRAYGSREAGVRYLDLDEDYNWSRNRHKAVAIRRGKRDLKCKARRHNKVDPLGLTDDGEAPGGGPCRAARNRQ